MLTVVKGYSELLLEEVDSTDGRLRRAAGEIYKAADRAATLTRQLLAFSRRQVLEPKLFDLNEVVADMDQMLERLIGEDIQLVSIRRSGLGQVKADPGQIEQVILNLVVNARDAMPQGGKLTIETANVELDEDYARTHVAVQPGAHVMLGVSDSGCGMDAETQAHLFEPFFTTKKKGEGTGLGLATVYGIVKQSGGNMWVYSEPGQGTTFKVYLPRVGEAAGTIAPPTPVADSASGVETILLVEDEKAVRELAARTLERNGYTVLTAADAAEATQLAQRHGHRIHLLLTDVVMPEVNGRQLAQRLASLRPGIKVLYMSGYTDDAIVHHGVLEPGVAFLQKPFTAADRPARYARHWSAKQAHNPRLITHGYLVSFARGTTGGADGTRTRDLLRDSTETEVTSDESGTSGKTVPWCVVHQPSLRRPWRESGSPARSL